VGPQGVNIENKILGGKGCIKKLPLRME